MSKDMYARIYIKGMSARKMRDLIQTIWSGLDDLCSRDISAQSMWCRLNEQTLADEKHHRSPMWRAVTPSPRSSTATAAKYKAALAVLREVPAPPVSWLAVGEIRTDWVVGHALAEKLGAPAELLARINLREEARDFMLLDYADDLV